MVRGWRRRFLSLCQPCAHLCVHRSSHSTAAPTNHQPKEGVQDRLRGGAHSDHGWPHHPCLVDVCARGVGECGVLRRRLWWWPVGDRRCVHAMCQRRSCHTMVFLHGNAGNIAHRLPNYAKLIEDVKCNILVRTWSLAVLLWTAGPSPIPWPGCRIPRVWQLHWRAF